MRGRLGHSLPILRGMLTRTNLLQYLIFAPTNTNMNEYPRLPEQPRTASRRSDLGGGSLSATQSQSESDDDEAELGLNVSSKKRKRDGLGSRRDMNVT